ncbi:hypothetical protein [Sphingomonas sanguinis]|uniref:hypothetical protein n=1 Tax=Sphingomonas sanguinis TaxID=33051 RepID=UPI00077BD203|nr:hypothetical protein [Sphingomonas sanguinis]
MNLVGKVITAPLKAIGLIPKTPKLPAPVPTPTRDDAREAVAMDDALRRRRGGAADIVTGRAGAEASAGSVGKETLGS